MNKTSTGSLSSATAAIVPSVKLPRPNNMGLLRYYLSLSVFINHFNVLTGHNFSWPTSSADRLGAFFVMSGFLIYGSYARHGDTRAFLVRRVKRIVPAYTLVILLAALAFVGVSALSAADYFGSWHWWRYTICNLLCLNFIEPTLPGVFEGNVMPAVNGAMWTMKVEWMMYLTVPVCAWLCNRLRRRINPLAFFGIIYAVSVAYSAFLLHQHEATGRDIYETLQRQCFGQMAYFYGGALLYFLYPRLMARKWWVLAAGALLYAATSVGGLHVALLRPMAMALLVVGLSFTGRWGAWADAPRGNISYDIYLFHFPVIQLFHNAGLVDAWGPYLSFAACAAVTVALACFSWFVIGRPILEGTGWWAALTRRLRRQPSLSAAP